MQSDLFKLNLKDLAKGAVSAVIAAVVFTVYGLFSQQGGFDLFSADWVYIGQLVVNAAFGAFVGYLGKNFTSDSEGKVFGKI